MLDRFVNSLCSNIQPVSWGIVGEYNIFIQSAKAYIHNRRKNMNKDIHVTMNVNINEIYIQTC